MKLDILAIIILLSLISCNQESIDSHYYEAYFQEENPNNSAQDSVCIIDTNVVHVLIHQDYEKLVLDLDLDTIPVYSSRDHYHKAHAHISHPPLIDLIIKSIDTTFSGRSLVKWSFEPSNRTLTREFILDNKPLSVGHYQLDSIHLNIGATEMRTYTLNANGDTLNKNQCRYELRKRCIGKKHGIWTFFDKNGKVHLTETWENGLRIN